MSHLTHFGVENFKVFNELTDFELAPLTILTGKNNSGKSSFLKALLLFKKNLKSNSLNSGNNLNSSFEELEFSFSELRLGSTNEIFNFYTKVKYITFNFGINSFMFPNGILNLWFSDEETNEILRLNGFSIKIDNKEVVLFINDRELKENCFKIDFQYFIERIHEALKQSSKTDKKDFGKKIGLFKERDSYKYNTIEDFNYAEPFLDLLNSGQLLKGFENVGVPDEIIKEDPRNLNGAKIDVEKNDLLKIQNQLIELFKRGIWVKNRILPVGTIDQFFSNFPSYLEEQIIEIFYKDEILKLKYDSQIFVYFSDRANYLNPDSDTRPFIKPIVHCFFDHVKTLLKDVFSDFSNSWENVSYLPSIRAKNERLYVVSKEGYVIQEFDQITFERITKDEKINQFFLKVLRDFEIGDDIKVTTFQRTATEIKIIRKDREILLGDLGFGYAQLLPIIFTILTTAEKWPYWRCKDEEGHSEVPNPIILIEEPESNLHPNFQAKLADLFVEASKLFGIQFIIETHSEYLIRRLQILTARKDINPDDISIYYFNNPTNISKIEIRSNGNLSQEFGTGFFDEADNLAINLLILSKHQKN